MKLERAWDLGPDAPEHWSKVSKCWVAGSCFEGRLVAVLVCMAVPLWKAGQALLNTDSGSDACKTSVVQEHGQLN